MLFFRFVAGFLMINRGLGASSRISTRFPVVRCHRLIFSLLSVV